MHKLRIFVVLVILSLALPAVSSQSNMPEVVVFTESEFPAADSSAPSGSQMTALFAQAKRSGAGQLTVALANPSTRLLVLPYGSSVPEEQWPAIKSFLDRGGNLLVLGGRPFSRSAYHDASGWHLRDYSVRFIRSLMIDQFQETPGSDGSQFQANPDIPLQIPAFAWKRAFSPVIRLSVVDLYPRGGATGSIDARLDTLAWGTRDGRKLSAPVIQVDHYRSGFDGGRWIPVDADLPHDFFDNGQLVRSLVERALQGVLVSDSAENTVIDLEDQATGARISLSLPAEHAAVAVVGKKEKKIIAKYSF